MLGYIELLDPRDNVRKKFEIKIITEKNGLILHKRASIDNEGIVYYPDKGGYVISHSATGWSLITNKTLRSIKQAFHVLADLPIDWHVNRPLNNLPADIHQKVAEAFHTQ